MNSYNQSDNFEYRISTVNYDALLDFYCDNDKNFMPSLSEEVNIEDYVKKIKDNAVTFEAWDDNNIIGIIAGYFNDSTNKKGFITSVIICPKYQGKGIASKLLKNAIEYANKNSFVNIGLEAHQTNKKAMRLYEKFDFKTISQNKNKFQMERKLLVN